jgi:hypothetical protein
MAGRASSSTEAIKKTAIFFSAAEQYLSCSLKSSTPSGWAPAVAATYCRKIHTLSYLLHDQCELRSMG